MVVSSKDATKSENLAKDMMPSDQDCDENSGLEVLENADEPAKEVIEPEGHEITDEYKTRIEDNLELATSKSSDSIDSSTPSKSKNPKKVTALITIVILILILLIGLAIWWFLIRPQGVNTSWQSSASTMSTQDSHQTTEDMTKALSPALAKLVYPKTGESWLARSEKVGDLNFYNKEFLQSDSLFEKPTYYKVGSRGDKTIYMATYAYELGESMDLFEMQQSGNGVVTSMIVNPDGSAKPQTENPSNLRSDITIDTTTHYDSLSLPANITLPDGEMIKQDSDNYGYLGDRIGGSQEAAGIQRQTLRTYGDTKLVKVSVPNVADGVTAVSYALDTPLGTERYYTYQPIGNSIVNYKWDNGVIVKPTDDKPDLAGIHGVAQGCGQSASKSVAVLSDVKDSDFVEAGKATDGKTVYAFKDENNSFVRLMYNEYKESADSGNFGDEKLVSIDEYLKQHALIVYKSPIGWLAYARNSYQVFGGCGKPVVYLYPQQTTKVRVAVGADVTKSAPLYSPSIGWTVIAKPNGGLTVNGKQYASLFWEGFGKGLYPAITSGTVVRRMDAAKTMRAQLAEQGLKQHEINDFMAYWQDKIPDSPYVRLTWFDTSQMNELAPLYISLTPDTVIRVFLDMKGYDQPVNIPKQTFESTPRQGFTVVEWGGLINGKMQ